MAFFLEASGYERPQWYEANAGLLARYNCPPRDEWSSKFWSPIIGAEACAVREGVGLFDITTLKRIEVTGNGALEFLERLTTGNLRKKPGSITYCLLLNERAGILSDITVMRRGEHDFFSRREQQHRYQLPEAGGTGHRACAGHHRRDRWAGTLRT